MSDTCPIEDHLHALATAADLPGFALAMCTIRIEESGPALRAVLARAADGASLTDDESLLVFRGLHVLGAARDPQACGPLLRLLRRPADEVDAVLGDAVAQTLPQIVAGVFDGDAEALFAAVIDRSVDEYARAALLDAATFLTWEGRIDRARFERFLERFYEERLAEDDDFAWIGWLDAIALLGLRPLACLVTRAWQEERIPEGILELRHFEDDLAEAERAPGDVGRLKRAGLGYIDDVVEALEWSRPASLDEEVDREPLWPVGLMPALNPWRHVGRNDPCPCGSGKKFKKCCQAIMDRAA